MAANGVTPDALFAVEAVMVRGDLLDQRVDAVVNPWNRNFVPRWLLRPGGVSGALKRATGPGPWRELHSRGLLSVGDAVVTGAGQMGHVQWLIHVAGIDAWWRASEEGVALSMRNAITAASDLGAATLATPLLGAGHGGLDPEVSQRAISPRVEHPCRSGNLRAVRLWRRLARGRSGR